MNDYKYEIMEICRDKALERYGKEYEDLPDDQQMKIFDEATLEWSDKQADMADALIDRMEDERCQG